MDIRPHVVEIYASAECMIWGIPTDRGADRPWHLNVLHANATVQTAWSIDPTVWALTQ